MAAEWRNFKAKMKAKRIDKGKGKKKDTISAFNEDNDTLVMQRLSAEVSGKAQKYSRIGAREFVSYEYSMWSLVRVFSEHDEILRREIKYEKNECVR